MKRRDPLGGGFQRLLSRLYVGALRTGDLERIERYKTKYGDGGFQRRIERRMRRVKLGSA